MASDIMNTMFCFIFSGLNIVLSILHKILGKPRESSKKITFLKVLAGWRALPQEGSIKAEWAATTTQIQKYRNTQIQKYIYKY